MLFFKTSGVAIFAAVCLLGETTGSAQAQNWYATEWSDGKVVNLQGLPDYANTQAISINGAGQAVGYSFNSVSMAALEWNGGTAINLGGLSASTSSIAWAINNHGVVVGTSYFGGTVTGQAIATEWAGGVGGSIINLGSLPGSGYSQALSINNAGQAVGESEVYLDGRSTLVATEWSGGKVINLGGLPDSTESVATGINDAGQVVGFSVVGGVEYVVEWSGGSITKLGSLPGSIDPEASDINNAGVVVGTSFFNTPYLNPSATEWNGSGVINLGGLPGSDNPIGPGFGSQAFGINNAGMVVGSSAVGTGLSQEIVAAEWSNGSVIELAGLPGEFEQSAARSINDAGQAVGYSYGQYVPPPPIPEPSTWAMMLIGFAGLGYAGHRARRSALAA